MAATYEGWAILIANVIGVLASATYHWHQHLIPFKKQEQVDNSVEVTVVRGGEKANVKTTEVVVGDVLYVQTGDLLAGDAVLISGENIKVDESAFTGEPEPVAKGSPELEPAADPFLYAGSAVQDGAGYALCIAVGEHTVKGKITAVPSANDSSSASISAEGEGEPELGNLSPEERLNQEEEKARTDKARHLTNLESYARRLVHLVGLSGAVAAVSLFAALVFIYFVSRAAADTELSRRSGSHAADVTRFALTTIALTAGAIPHGLTLAVTVTLAYSMKKLMTINSLLRRLQALEALGCVTDLCADKTVLTLDQMKVVAGALAGREWKDGSQPEDWDLPEVVYQSLALTNTAQFYKNAEAEGKEKGTWTGNKYDVALVDFLETQLGRDGRKMSKQYGEPLMTTPFSAVRKRLYVAHEVDGQVRVFVKGAAEIVFRCCRRFQDGDQVRDKTSKDDKGMQRKLEQFSDKALRLIGLAYVDLDAEPADWASFVEKGENLVFVGVVGIENPLRPSVSSAVADCNRAGVMVRLVTGESLVSARRTATRAGILRKKDGLILDAGEFRQLSDDELEEVLPQLQVLARCTHPDKVKLVSALRRRGHVVAVTGNGTGDAPALSLADVGFSMGVATEVSKLAADVVVLDDNIASIVKALPWGRNIYESVRKFLQFQLTLSLVAVLIAYLGASQDAASGGAGQSPLTPIQLIWISWISGTLSAVALTSESPPKELFERGPHGKSEALVSPAMWVHIIGQSAYQLCLLLVILGAASRFMAAEPYQGDTTILVATEGWCQLYMEPLEANSEALDEGYGYWARCVDHVNQTMADEPDTSLTYSDLMCQCLAGTVKKIHYTFIFNTFISMQLFNQVNCRRIHNSNFNIFQGLHKSFLFLGLWIATALFQGLYVNTFGGFGGVTRINANLWGWSILFGALSLPYGLLLKLISLGLRCEA